MIHDFQKESQILSHLTREQFPTLPQLILNALWSREYSSISASCSHVASSLHDRALTCICGCYGELCSDNDFCSDVFIHRVVCRFSESFDYIMNCRLWNIQSLSNFTLRKLFLKLLHSLYKFSRQSLFDRDSTSPSCSFYTRSCH